MTKIKNLPIHQRPREKLIEKGPSGLTDSELIAILLRTGVKGKSAIQLAKELLNQFTLSELLNISLHELTQIKGLGTAKAAQLFSSLELAKRAMDSSSELPLVNAERVINLLVSFKTKNKEYFIALYLNARHHLLKQEIISIGHLTGSLVHPREVFKPAFELSSASLILAHNHPSGDPTPSQDDIKITQRLVEAGKILDIPIFDHLIITKDKWSSMKELGYI